MIAMANSLWNGVQHLEYFLLQLRTFPGSLIFTQGRCKIHKAVKIGAVALLTAGMVVSTPVASSAKEKAKADNAAVKEWTRTADNSAPPSTENSNPNNEDADGASWAPGGLGAINSIVVKGRGLHVDTAAATYNPSTGALAGNTCVDSFEISYYEGGQRKVETAGHSCAPLRAAHVFQINRSLDANTPVCGRVQIKGEWGNYACIDILP